MAGNDRPWGFGAHVRSSDTPQKKKKTSDLQITKILVSSDCATVVKDIKAGEGGRYGALIEEIIAGSREFEICNFIHESRTRNYEVDSLAKYIPYL